MTVPRPCPEMLWREGAKLDCDELSSLLQDCTGYAVESITDENGDSAFYVVDLLGERLDDGYPFPDLGSVKNLVGWRIDEALADCWADCYPLTRCFHVLSVPIRSRLCR